MAKKRATGLRGRPRQGDEALDVRLTVMVTESMDAALRARSGGDVSPFVRKAIERALAGKMKARAKVKAKTKRTRPKRGRKHRSA